MYKLKTNRSKSASEIILNGALTIGKLAEMKEVFLKALKKQKNIIIDLSEGNDFDMAFLQLLISFNKTCHDEGIELNLNPSLPQDYLELINASGIYAYSWLLGNPETEIEGGENE